MKNGNVEDTVLFRFVDQGGELNINFCLQGQSDLQSYSIKTSEDSQEIQEKHLNHLKKILPKKQ